MVIILDTIHIWFFFKNKRQGTTYTFWSRLFLNLWRKGIEAIWITIFDTSIEEISILNSVHNQDKSFLDIEVLFLTDGEEDFIHYIFGDGKTSNATSNDHYYHNNTKISKSIHFADIIGKIKDAIYKETIEQIVKKKINTSVELNNIFKLKTDKDYKVFHMNVAPYKIFIYHK